MEPGVIMATQTLKRNLLVTLYREGKKNLTLCFLLPLKGEVKKGLTLVACFLCVEIPGLPACYPLTSIRIFSNESVLCIRCQSIGASASASVLPVNIQGWFPLGWTGWISLQSKGLSRVFSNTTVQKHLNCDWATVIIKHDITQPEEGMKLAHL